MSPTRAQVNESVVQWAREAAGLDLETAARKLGVAQRRVAAWEAGEQRPTVGQLRKMAHVYGRTLAFFFRRNLPDDDLPQPPDYRTMAPAQSSAMSFDLRRQLREALQRRHTLLDLESDVTTFRSPSLSNADDDESALLIRQTLDVRVDTQFEADTYYEMLGTWTRALEGAGVLVFQSSDVEVDEARGVSLVLDPLPIILLAGKDSPAAKMFTLLHEVFHIVRGTGGLCNELDDRVREERRCNALAAATLMPQSSFFADFERLQSVEMVARRYKVSRLAAAIRLRQRRLIDAGTVERVRQEMDEAVAHREQSSGFAPVPTMRLRDLGRRYTGAVLDAYYRDEITLTDASQLLKTKVRHFPKIEDALRRERGRGVTTKPEAQRGADTRE